MPDDVTPFPGATPRDLLAGVLDWQDRHPDDPRLPEVLVAAIRRTLAGPPEEAREAAEALYESMAAKPREVVLAEILAYGAAREAAREPLAAVEARLEERARLLIAERRTERNALQRHAYDNLIEETRTHIQWVREARAARRGEGEGA